MSSMYRMTPLVEVPPIRASTPMYSMAPLLPADIGKIGGSGSSTSSSSGAAAAGGTAGRLALLEQRQVQLLDNLKNLCADLGVAPSTGGTAVVPAAHAADDANLPPAKRQPPAEQANQPPAKVDITMMANKDAPPRTTLLVAQHLKLEGKTFRQRQFWHNNNGPMPSNFREANPAHNDTCDLRIDIIWKPEPRTLTRVSAVSHAPFEGDLAAARHLCRTFHSRLYPEADPLQAAQVDHWVDQAASMEASNKDAKQVLKNLNQTLGQASYLTGEAVTLADLAVYGILRSHVTTALPSNVKKWVKKMDESPEVLEVEAILSSVTASNE